MGWGHRTATLQHRWTRAHTWLTHHSSPRNDQGSAMLMAVVATVAAAGIGLIAVTAITRSITNENRVKDQEVVDLLAVSGAEEAFGRIVRDRDGLFEITGNQIAAVTVAAHPGFGTDPDTAAGPWVRFNEYGQVVPCTSPEGEPDARLPCFTIRLGASPDLETATTAIIDVTARQCHQADPLASTCVRSRVQTTLKARSFLEDLISVQNAFTADAGATLSGTTRTGDVLPTPLAADFEGLAGLTLVSSSIRIGDVFTVSSSAGVTTAALPVNGVIFVKGDLEIEEISALTPMTIAATGTVTISGNVLSTGLVTIISTDANIEIATTSEAELRIDAVLMATSTSAGTGIIRTGFISPPTSTTTSTLVLTGAVVARTLGPFTETFTADDEEVVLGYQLLWNFDEGLRRDQSPFGIVQVRGRWLRIDQVAVFPGN